MVEGGTGKRRCSLYMDASGGSDESEEGMKGKAGCAVSSFGGLEGGTVWTRYAQTGLGRSDRRTGLEVDATVGVGDGEDARCDAMAAGSIEGGAGASGRAVTRDSAW